MTPLLPSKLIAGTMKWGTWGSQFNRSAYSEMIAHCLELGIDTFDHADIYGDYSTEQEFGDAACQMGLRRDSFKIITKCGIRLVSPNRPGHKIKSYDSSKEHIIGSVERSLRNFKTDYLDCLLLHRPDPLMDPVELAEAFSSLSASGKVLSFGVSNFSVSQVQLLLKYYPITVHQLEVSIIQLQPFIDGTLDQCLVNRLTPLAWSPLGGGNLFSPLTTDERSQRLIATAGYLADKYNCTPDLVLLSWLFSHPSGIHPVLGTSRKERIRSACQAVNISLTREDWFYLWRASTGIEVP
jgi:predicted oxidoreductase